MPASSQKVKEFLLNERFQRWVQFPTAEDEAYWQQYLRQYPESRTAMEEARKLLLALRFEEKPRSSQTKLANKAKIDQALLADSTIEKSGREVQLSTTQSKSGFRWRGIAAAVGTLLLVVSVYLMMSTSSDESMYSTAYGETYSILLPDSSRVTLNANSTLRWQNDWTEEQDRTVWLEGEAFFEVEKKKTTQGKPVKFTVHSDDVNVEVLGTAFNVNNRHQEIKVVLSSGIVQLKLPQEAGPQPREISMEPGDMVSVSKVKKEVVKKVVDTSKYTAWRENKLLFEHTPIAEIIQLIEDNYGLKVNVNSPALLEREFTGTAPADQLDILLDKMSVVYNLKIDRNEDEINMNQR